MICIMKTYPAAQTLGFVDVELVCNGWRRPNAAAIGLINLIYNLARLESRFRIATAKDRCLKSED